MKGMKGWEIYIYFFLPVQCFWESLHGPESQYFTLDTRKAG